MTTAPVRTSLWGDLRRRIEDAPETEGPAAERLRREADPSAWRPRLASDIEIKRFPLRGGGEYAMLANPRDLIHYRLTSEEADLLELMDGTRSVKEIVLDRFRASGDMELAIVAELVHELRVGNFLDTRYVDVYAAIEREMEPPPTISRRIYGFLRTLQLEWSGAERLVRWFYDHGLRAFFSRWAQPPAAVVAIGGLIAFAAATRTGTFRLSVGSAAVSSLILIGLNYFLTFVHELGHSLVLIHNGRRVKSAGFMIYFGSPAFFVEASDGLMMERRQRILQAFAGPYAELIVAGAAALFAWAFPDAAISQILYTFAALNYLILFFNLIPLLELDGYWILSDFLQIPDLRPRSLAFIRRDLWAKLLSRARIARQEWGLAAYGIVGVAFTIFSFYTAFFFWRHVFGGLVSDLWAGGMTGRTILVALAVLVGGPVLRGVIDLGRVLLRRIVDLIDRLRFRLERSWRVEAAGLIDDLTLFDDVPVEVLNELAGSVRLRRLAPSQTLARQGERADAFYVVRKGHVQVIEEDPSTGEHRVLRTLGRGESVGELGVASGALRSATIRATEVTEVFEVSKGSFDRLLAGMAQVPHFEPTLQKLAELRELPPFASLAPEELRRLLEVGEWLDVAPGTELIRQGEPGDAFYAIRSGQLDVLRDGQQASVLGPRDHVGEIALLLAVPRTATVVARTPARLFRLGPDGFEELVAGAFRRGALRPHLAIDRTLGH